MAQQSNVTLVLGGTGKTGKRVAKRLTDAGVTVRIGSRPGFDWNDVSTWAPALEGARAVYIAYAPDLAVPGADEHITELVAHAKAVGVSKLVLLSGRGEAEAEVCENIVRSSGLTWTVLRAAWFAQNFTEGAMADEVRSGSLTIPVDGVPEPFVDIEDIAEIAAQALTSDRHDNRLYELTGPRALTFAEAAAALGVQFNPVPLGAYLDIVRETGAPAEAVSLLQYLFGTLFDGRNVTPASGVREALGREAHDFREAIKAER